MRPADVEITVARVLRDLEQGRPTEDDVRLEVKREWPRADFSSARRIAAHANAARGEDIIWIIGADEKARVVPGASGIDAATWYAQITSYFENLWSPPLQTQVVPWRAVTVLALVFRTDGSPFIVKHADHFEVPWRGSTRVRSAMRHELLEMLIPPARLPHVEILNGQLGQSRSGSEIVPLAFCLALSLYVTPGNDSRVVLPMHRMRGVIMDEHGKQRVEFDAFEADANHLVTTLATKKVEIDSPFLQITRDEIILTRPARFRLLAFGEEREFDVRRLHDECVAEVSLRPAGGDSGIVLRPHLITTSPDDGEESSWHYVPDAILNRTNLTSA